MMTMMMTMTTTLLSSSGGGSWAQSDIDRLLLQKATTSESENHKRERVIVRLKGGDPFLFGRARSEIDALRSAGVPYAYAPGISSCIAGPHLGGIPLTDASLGCQSFGVWSGTDAFGGFRGLEGEGDGGGGMGGGRRRRWSSGVDVLVFLMIGRLDKLDALCRCIVADHHRDDDGDCGDDDDAGGKGWNEDTPCAVIQNAGGARREGGGEADGESTTTATSPVQKVWRSTLGNIAKDIRDEDPARTSVSPAVFVVGPTASLDLLSQDYSSQ